MNDNVVLIINNGAYGKRMCEIVQAYGLNFVEFKSHLDGAVDLAALENLIQKSFCKISHLAVVHNETTTGLLNDIESIGKLCRKYPIGFDSRCYEFLRSDSDPRERYEH